jgi:hypothetical protein
MKKTVKKTLSGIGIAFLCLIIFGQIAKTAMKPAMEKSAERSEFARSVERANRDCPIPVAMGKGAVTSIKLEEGYLTYYLSYSPDFLNVLGRLNDENKVKEGLLMCFLCVNGQGKNQGDLLMDLLIRFNYGLRVVISKSAIGKYDFKASVDEIKTLRKRYQLNPHEALYNLLSLSIEAECSGLPMAIDEGMLMTDYRLEGENVAIIILVDEDMYSIEEMCENYNEIKASMINGGLNDPDAKALLDMCKVSHTGLIYRMYGNQSNKKFEVLITSDEIRRIVKTPSNINIQ